MAPSSIPHASWTVCVCPLDLAWDRCGSQWPIEAQRSAVISGLISEDCHPTALTHCSITVRKKSTPVNGIKVTLLQRRSGAVAKTPRSTEICPRRFKICPLAIILKHPYHRQICAKAHHPETQGIHDREHQTEDKKHKAISGRDN